MNLFTEQKQTHRHRKHTWFRKQTWLPQGRGEVGEGVIGSLGLADANYYILDG